MSDARRSRVAVFGASGYVGERARAAAGGASQRGARVSGGERVGWPRAGGGPSSPRRFSYRWLGAGSARCRFGGRPGVLRIPLGTRGSNLVELQAVADRRTGTAVVAGALDNLVKGAAGQAVQNMNLMAGFDPTAGLTPSAVY